MNARRRRGLVTGLALAAASGGCRQILGIGQPEFDAGGTGGASAASSGHASTGGGASSSAGTGGGASSSAGTGGSASSAASSGSGGSAPCPIGHLLISEVRTHGLNGNADEFVELYNPTSTEVPLDSLWSLEGRAVDPPVSSYTLRWKGNGMTIPAHGHYLITGASALYTGPPGDGTLSTGITDGASLRLMHSGSAVDAVCYYHANDLAMAQAFLDVAVPYTCEGLPTPNPHDGTSSTANDSSIERLPGGTLGNCTDSGSNFSDFQIQSPSTPLNTLAPATP